MGDGESAIPLSKKRAAGREISRDNPGLDDEEDISEQETGTFKKASDEVLASRRIVKVRRNQTSSAPSSNPFAGIRLTPVTGLNSATPASTATMESEKKVPEDDGNNLLKEVADETNAVTAKPTETKADDREKPKIIASEKVISEVNASGVAGEKAKEGIIDEVEDSKGTEGGSAENKDIEEAKEEDKAEVEDNKEIEGKSAENKEEKENGNERTEKTGESASFSSFQQLSSGQNAFTGLAGTGFSSSTFSFGISNDGTSAICGSGSLFGQPSSFNVANNGSSLFGNQGAPTGAKSEGGIGFPSMQEVSVETGEEDEKAVFTADSVLFEFLDGGWRERGKGELKVNVPTAGSGKARLVMRARGNYRLILNASLYPDMKLTSMDKKGITFACVNSSGEGKDGLSTFALKFKEVSLVDEFRSVVTEHTGGRTAVLKTPENSPKASDE